MNIDPHTAAGHAGHDGGDYSFCSDGCRQDFVADPARYLTPAAALSVVAQTDRLRGAQPGADPDDSHAPAVDPVVGAERDENKENTMVDSSQQATDPVCGMRVDPATAAANVEHEGATYYFCSTHCATTFTADPHKYRVGDGV